MGWGPGTLVALRNHPLGLRLQTTWCGRGVAAEWRECQATSFATCASWRLHATQVSVSLTLDPRKVSHLDEELDGLKADLGRMAHVSHRSNLAIVSLICNVERTNTILRQVRRRRRGPCWRWATTSREALPVGSRAALVAPCDAVGRARGGQIASTLVSSSCLPGLLAAAAGRVGHAHALGRVLRRLMLAHVLCQRKAAHTSHGINTYSPAVACAHPPGALQVFDVLDAGLHLTHLLTAHLLLRPNTSAGV